MANHARGLVCVLGNHSALRLVPLAFQLLVLPRRLILIVTFLWAYNLLLFFLRLVSNFYRKLVKNAREGGEELTGVLVLLKHAAVVVHLVLVDLHHLPRKRILRLQTNSALQAVFFPIYRNDQEELG